MIDGIHHVGFTVRDLEKSVGFYRAVLEGRIVSEREADGGYLATLTGYPGVRFRQVILAVGADLLELIEYIEPRPEPNDASKNRPGTGHACYRVDDLAAVHARLRTLGAKVESGPVAVVTGPNKGALALFAYDPDGIAIEFLQSAHGPAERRQP